ncbi:hypothetical protein LWI28_000010 [Acer negundo]|uniref:Uncharacterized protein n=1 Tax=Acer negundo TaxID=4023 RepID=A0AAD5NTB9_ACENE|nr:hypothetical protein LWI28_000010 [Acer negundo]
MSPFLDRELTRLGDCNEQLSMCVFCVLNDYKYFNPPITEGICKAVAYECLVDTRNDPIGNALEFVKRLREFRELKFKEQHSRIYGYGYIGARTAIQKFGIKDALKQICKKTDKGRTNATMIMEEDLELDEYDYYA